MSTHVQRMLPLYESKMIHLYDHRWATFDPDGSIRDVTDDEKQDPLFAPLPRYWVRESVAVDRAQLDNWVLGVRDVTNSTNERTVIPALFPRAAAGNNLPIILDGTEPKQLAAVLSSFALDFLARPKVGGVHLNFYIANQLPVLPPGVFSEECGWSRGTVGAWVERRVDSLVEGAWDPAGRAETISELDAAMFHLYGIDRDDVDYIMETFPIVKRKDIAAHGEFLTKRRILEIYDAMAEAKATGATYVSPLDVGDAQ